jgi:CheY-like chemotaxis protein
MNGVRLFVRAPDERRGPVDVRDVIEHALSVLGHEVRQKAFVEKHLEEVPLVSGNAGQLGDLFVNLVTNALDSIPPGKPQEHRLMVRTSTSPRGEVVVDVEDDGSGMTDDVRNKIFEPFFSTKPPGFGTGLGLSICHGIVRSHGGSIEVETQAGRGTRFRVLLPGEPSVATAPAAPTARTRRERLLIVDDDESVGSALGRLLGREYDTKVIVDPRAALEWLERARPRPDVILCDFFLGTMTGQDVYERLRRTHRDMSDQMIFMTGAAFTEQARRFLDAVSNPVLDKPFTDTDFKKAVEKLPRQVRATSRMRLRAPSTDEALTTSPRARDRK